MIREAVTREELETWTRIRNLVVPAEPATLDDVLRTIDREPERRLFIASLHGEPAGCAFAAPSESMPGCTAVIPRVLRAARRRGLGEALLRVCSDHARTLGSEALSSHVQADDPDGAAFAERFGFAEVDRQIELVRRLRPSEPPADSPAGVEIVPLQPGHAERFRPVAVEAAADMPLPGPVTERVVDDWVDDLLHASAAFVAVVDGDVVGFASLTANGARPGVLEHGLTAVARSQRGRGIATALKRRLVVWAAANGYRELVTWTQQGNAAMQAVNAGVGFRPGVETITMRGPLLPASGCLDPQAL